jgi:hypothetical protein
MEMSNYLHLLLLTAVSLFKSLQRLEAENAVVPSENSPRFDSALNQAGWSFRKAQGFLRDDLVAWEQREKRLAVAAVFAAQFSVQFPVKQRICREIS